MLFSKKTFTTAIALVAVMISHGSGLTPEQPIVTLSTATPYSSVINQASTTGAETPAPTPEAAPYLTPAATSEPTPQPTPYLTPQQTHESTPEPTPEATPAPTPEPTPAPTPEATPAPTPEATPEPTPEPTPEATPEPTPEPTFEPTPQVTTATPSTSASPTITPAYHPPTSTPSESRHVRPTTSRRSTPTQSKPISTGICPGAAPIPSVCRRAPNWTLLRVFGADGPFCAKGPNYCSESITDSCPGPQRGLPYGSYCAQLRDGTFGCLPHSSCSDGSKLEDGEIQPEDPPTIEEPTPSDDAETPSPTDEMSGCLLDYTVPDLDACAGDNLLVGGWAPISVRGRYHFCTQVTPEHPRFCVADIIGNCPKAQPGLPYGSTCQFLNETQVYGCVPRTTCVENDPTPEPTPAPTPSHTGCELTTN